MSEEKKLVNFATLKDIKAKKEAAREFLRPKDIKEVGGFGVSTKGTKANPTCFGNYTGDNANYGGECQGCQVLEECKRNSPLKKGFGYASDVKCPLCGKGCEEIQDNYFACYGGHEFDKGTTKEELIKIYEELNKKKGVFGEVAETPVRAAQLSVENGKDNTVTQGTSEPTGSTATTETLETIQPKILKKQKQYPITIPTIQSNDPNLAMIEADQQYRIISEINLLKFAVQSVLESGDYYGKTPTRSGCHKIQTIFNISTEIIEEKYWKEDNQWIALYRVKAISENGRYTEAIGVCEQDEKGRNRTFHDTLATAQTRAMNRAILDLVGFGVVSAEEINDDVGQGGFE